MSNSLTIDKISSPLSGNVSLPLSKSLCNRYLILQAISSGAFTLTQISDSDDSQILHSLLSNPPTDGIYDAHHAGTTSRFLLAYLTTQPGTQTLTGSDRLKSRPIRPLAEALISLGADITYLEEEDSLPIRIGEATQLKSEVTIDGSVSSQFITALLLIAPALPDGLTLHIAGELVSKPYLDMTLGIFKQLGIDYSLDGNNIHVPHQAIKPQADVQVEADWSAASYFIALVATLPKSKIFVPYLYDNSLQGDRKMLETIDKYGVSYAFANGGLHLENPHETVQIPPIVELDLSDTPDLFQTFATLHAVLGCQALYTGLETLAHKETDRIAAMKTELAKVGSHIMKLPPKFSKSSKTFYLQEGKIDTSATPTFDTYQDHRMAMSLSILATQMPVIINDADVVSKSFPRYWAEFGATR